MFVGAFFSALYFYSEFISCKIKIDFIFDGFNFDCFYGTLVYIHANGSCGLFFVAESSTLFFFCAFLAKKQAHQTKQNFGGKAARFSTPFLWKCSHTNDSTCRFTAVIYSFLLLKPAENGFLPYGWELTYSKNCRKCFQLSKNNERYILTKPKKMI